MIIFDLIENNDIDGIKKLIHSGVNLNEKNSFGYTPLHAASQRGLHEMAELLINSGANVNLLDNTFKWTPLHFAVKINNIKLVKLLCINGANINASDGMCKQTPLHIASCYEYMEISLLLIEYGADYTMKTTRDRTIFDLSKPEFIAIITNKIIELELYKLWFLEVDKYESFIQWIPLELLEDLCSQINQ